MYMHDIICLLLVAASCDFIAFADDKMYIATRIACVCASASVCVYVCLCVSVSMYVYVCACMCMCVCMCVQMNLRECVEIMQETFVDHSFLSQENIEKTYLKRNNKRLEVAMPASKAVEPLTRCKVCTLMYGATL